MSHAIVIEKIDYSFQKGFWRTTVPVLKQMSFMIPKRCLFGLLGANGAGKTTLIHLLTGLRIPRCGFVSLAGFPAHSAEARQQLGYLPERPSFPEHLTAEEFLKYSGVLSGMNGQKLKMRVYEVLHQVNLFSFSRQVLRKFSKGMLQRVGIAQALLHQPDILVLDEPMSGLDPLGRQEVRMLLKRLVLEGRTVIFSSHILNDIETLCEYVALIQSGCLIKVGPVSEWINFQKSFIQIHFELKCFSPDLWPEFKTCLKGPMGWQGIVVDQATLHLILDRLLKEKATIQLIQPVETGLEKFFQKDMM